MDVNDNAPEWTMVPFPYLSVVTASAPSNTLVYKLQARDSDAGVNGEVEYFLSDGKQLLHLPYVSFTANVYCTMLRSICVFT